MIHLMEKPKVQGPRRVDFTPPLRLDIGAGEHRRDANFTTVDAYFPADIKAEMWDLPFPDSCCEEIWCAHTLEHAPCVKISATLKEFVRVLKPGKRAIVQVPDFNYVARYWLTGPDRQWAERMVFGMQAHEGEFHKSAFTHETLKADMEAAGFVEVLIRMVWTHNQDTIQASGRKPK